MSISLSLAGWEAEGLRCPDHEVSFEATSDRVYSISLLQMPNGTGKTTTLQLLRAALSGSAERDSWSGSRIRAFAKKGNEGGVGAFRVRLLLNGRLITICLNFRFDQGTVSYTTTVASGIKDGFRPPQQIEKFLVPQFVNFFVFDGELAEHLLSRDHTDAQVVIENLFQLNLFAEVSAQINLFWQRQTEGRSATEERGLARRRNRVELLRERLLTLKGARTELSKRYETAKKSLSNNKSKFEASLERERENGERLRQAQLALSASTNAVAKSVRETLHRLRDPHALSSRFGAEMTHLKASLDRVKLPESTAREFFEELADEPRCVCGRVLDDDHRKEIRERAKHYLGSDDVALLNALKSDIANLIGADVSSHANDLAHRIDVLKNAVRAEDEQRTAYGLLENDAVASDPDLQKAKEVIEKIEEYLRGLETERQKFESADDSAGDENTFGIRILERRLEDAERMLAEITNTLSMRRKRNVLVQIMESALQKAKVGISQEICAETNARISEVMPNNAIRVQQIDRCLVLEGQEGGSAGETLSVAYAFLATLFNRVEHQLPFIVDSPANPIDLKVRAKVAELIPRLTQQFVAFTISSERQGFIAPLEAAAQSPINYITLFRRGPAGSGRDPSAMSGATSTGDGVIVIGREFFSRFHIEEDDKTNGV